MLAVEDMLELIEEAGIDAVRAKSVALTAYAIELADEILAPLGVTIGSPRDPGRRGGHVTLVHPKAQRAHRLALDARRDPRLPRARTAYGSGCRRCRRRSRRYGAGMYAVRDELERAGDPHQRATASRSASRSPTGRRGCRRRRPRSTGRYVALEPVAAAHAPALYAALAAEEDDASWTYRHDERPADEAGHAAR